MRHKNDVPAFFVYGEPSRTLDVGFVHVETVMERKSVHFGHVAPHQHPQLGQITYWYAGSGTYRIEERTWNFSAPAVSFVPSSIVHGFDVDEASDAVVISISDDLLRALEEQVDLDLTQPCMLGGSPSDPPWSRLDALIRMVEDEYRATSAASQRLISGLIGVVLSQISKLGGVQGTDETAPGRKLAIALRREIDRHYRENLQVSHYVDLLKSTSHLVDKAARETFGKTIKEMLMERRLLEAKRLLMFTIRPVEDIGREIGFDDPAYFSRFFRKQTGEAPAAWRRRTIDR